MIFQACDCGSIGRANREARVPRKATSTWLSMTVLAPGFLRSWSMKHAATVHKGGEPQRSGASTLVTSDSFIIAPQDPILVTGAAGFIGSRVVETSAGSWVSKSDLPRKALQ